MNLHEFFQAADPPQLAEEILSQWESFCKIAKAIETLHDFNYKGANWSGYVVTVQYLDLSDSTSIAGMATSSLVTCFS